MKTVTKFTADDGTEFETREACEAHEVGLVEQKLVGLTIEQVREALARTDVGLADAIEAIGLRITKVRLEAGARRRAGKTSGAAEAPAQVQHDGSSGTPPAGSKKRASA